MESRFLIGLKYNQSIIHIDYSTVPKFLDDKVYIDNDEYLFILDGVVLNKKEIWNNSYSSSWPDFLLRLYLDEGSTFFKALKGSYHGVLYNKKSRELICFSDHISSKPLFYYQDSNFFLVSRSCIEIFDYLKKQNVQIGLDEIGAYFLLSYGFPIEDKTIMEDVKRILPGHFVHVQEDKINIDTFHNLSNEPLLNDLSDDELIEEIDTRYRKAVGRQFDKDLEYGYEHLVALSGGLDSRMTSWVAHDMGYTKQLNFTFSESNYFDETIPKEIAHDLKHEWIFSFLDNGLFLEDVDKITSISGGNVLYYGLAHGNRMLEKLNMSRFGLVHSGQLGDVVLGTFNSSKEQNENYSLGDGAYSKTFIPKLKDYALRDYPNQEIFKFYTRGFVGANYGLLVSQQYTETFSPFYDIDFLTFCLQIPIEKRFNHRLYKSWVAKKYPKAGEYIWEKTGQKVNSNKQLKIKGKEYSFKQLYKYLLKQTIYKFSSFDNYGIASKNHMNPLEYWFKTNVFLEHFYNEYFEHNIKYLDIYPGLKQNVSELHKTATSVERIQILSLLSIAKLIYD